MPIVAKAQMGNLVQKNVTSDKFTVTTSDYFDIYTLYPEVLREPIPTPGKYENLSEGIPPAQGTTHDSFSELEDIATLQESASEPNNNCTPHLSLSLIHLKSLGILCQFRTLLQRKLPLEY